MANLAKFTIDGTASSPGGYDATISQVLDFALEGGPANLVQRWTLQVYDAADAGSPLASKNAPTLTLVGATSGQKVDAATPASGITCTMPGSGVHSWLIRSIVNGGVDASGNANPDYVFERFVAIKTGSGLRKIVGTEATQYGPRGWADAQNDLIDAGAGPLTAPGGAGDANKIAAASGAGTNLQYAAGIRLGNSGNSLDFGATPATAGLVRVGNNPGTVIGYRSYAATNRVALAVSSDGSTFDDVFVGDSNATDGNFTLYLGAKGQLVLQTAGLTRATINAGGLTVKNSYNINGRNLLDNADILIATIGSDNANYFGATNSAACYLRSGAGIGFRLDGVTDGFSLSSQVGLIKSNFTDGSATSFALRAAGSTGSNNSGGRLRLDGGRRAGTGNYGAVSMRLNQDDSTFFTMVEAAHLANLRRIVALCVRADLTTTDMPTNTGDGVIFIGNAATVPTANCGNGGILYVESGALKYRGNSGTVSVLGTA